MYGPSIRIHKLLGLDQNRNKKYITTEISTPAFDVYDNEKDKPKQKVLLAGDLYVRCSKPINSTSVETEWTPWRRLAFADEIPKDPCPFPLGFSFLTTSAYLSTNITVLKTAYPDTTWAYAQAPGISNAYNIKRTK